MGANAGLNINLDAIFKNKDTVVMVALIGISFLAGNSLYQGQMKQHRLMQEKIQIEKEKSAILTRIVVLNEKIKKLRQRSWDTIDTQMILEKIFNIGLDFRIKIKGISPAGKRDDKDFVVVPFTVDGEGAYRDIFGFIKALETYPKLLKVKSIATAPLNRPQEGTGEPLLSVVMGVEAFYFK